MSTTKSIKTFTVLIPIYFNDTSLYKVINDCLTSLKDTHDNINLLIADDASPLGCPWENKANCFIGQAKNLGFTSNVNSGLEFWYDNNLSDVIVIANDDLYFEADNLERYRDCSGVGIWFPNTTDGGDLPTFGSIWGITRATYRKLGGLNTKYKHFYSDTDYYDRAVKAGVPITKWSDIVISHKESATYKTIDKTALLEKDRKVFERINK